jgi:hypothetical protein
VNGRTGIGGTRRLPRAEQLAFMVGSRSAELIEAGGLRAVETGWMAAAETRTPDATKPLAGREASMDGKQDRCPCEEDSEDGERDGRVVLDT